MTDTRFPDGFLWGAATSSYQIEGYPLADGAGESIWHRFCREPGRIADGSTGDRACEHYRRWRDDVALMTELGLRGYRFSTAWPRVFPDGGGRMNPAGVEFYDRLVDELLAAGIEPAITLYHWDLPAALHDRGGWLNRDTARWFGDYAAAMTQALGDRVTTWMTLNEPAVSAVLGYLTGEHAPGIRDPAAAITAAHHLLLAHGTAVLLMREAAPGPIQIGLAPSISPGYPATESEADRAAADRWDKAQTWWYLDPILRGAYPEETAERLAEYGPPIEPGDLDRMHAPIDFLGVNYYSRTVVRASPDAGPLDLEPAPGDGPKTAMGWEIFPEGLDHTLRMVHERYGIDALYITENGAAFNDQVTRGRDGEPPRVDDPDRVDYLRSHLAAAADAIAAGVPLRGYYAWSLMDNFEWSFGYTKRFGLVYVDYETQRRIPKESARWYADVIARNGL